MYSTNSNGDFISWDEDYSVTKCDITPGKPEDLDIEVQLDSKYIPLLWLNICSGMKRASREKGIAVLGKKKGAELVLKYNSMLKYAHCLKK